MRTFSNVALTLLAASILVFPARGDVGPGPGVDAELVDDGRRIEAASNLATQLRKGIDRSQFDTWAQVSLRDFDDQQILDFVRDSIRLEVYDGLLRGAAGTLMSGAGNSLDQAVLAARLLGDAGFDVRIAHGTLAEPEVDRLLRSMRPPEARPTPVLSSSSAPSDVLDELGLLDARSSALAQFLLEESAELDLRESELQILQRMRQEAARYFWVEYRSGPADRWRSAHPAFPESGGVPEPEAEGYFANEVPLPLQHRLRVQAFIGRLEDGKCATEAVMDPWERPVASLLGRPLVYVNFNARQLANSGAGSNLYFPMFNGEPAGRVAFNELGLTVPLDAAGAPAASVVATGATRLLGAAETLSTLSDEAVGGGSATADPPLLQLGASWLEFTLIAPDGTETRHARSLLRTRACTQAPAAGYVSESSRLDVQDLQELTREQIVMVDSGSYPDGYVLDRLLEGLLALGPMMEAVTRDSDGVASLSADRIPDYPQWPDYLVGLLFFALTEHAPTGGISYRDTPSLVVFSRDLHEVDPGRLSFDIVENRRRSLMWVDSDLRIDASGLAKRGTMETLLETFLLGTAGDNTKNAALLTESLLAQNPDSGLIPLLPGQPIPEVCVGALPASAREALDSGYVVMLPECGSLDGQADFWWRVDPATGVVLGMTQDGLGGVTHEYGVKLVKNTIQIGRLARLCFHMDHIGPMLAKYVKVVFGDVGTYLRMVYGEDIAVGLDKASACEKPLVRAMLGV